MFIHQSINHLLIHQSPFAHQASINQSIHSSINPSIHQSMNQSSIINQPIKYQSANQLSINQSINHQSANQPINYQSANQLSIIHHPFIHHPQFNQSTNQPIMDCQIKGIPVALAVEFSHWLWNSLRATGSNKHDLSTTAVCKHFHHSYKSRSDNSGLKGSNICGSMYKLSQLPRARAFATTWVGTHSVPYS